MFIGLGWRACRINRGTLKNLKNIIIFFLFCENFSTVCFYGDPSRIIKEKRERERTWGGDFNYSTPTQLRHLDTRPKVRPFWIKCEIFFPSFHHLVKESLLFSSSVRTKGERHTKKNRWRLYVVQCIRVVVVVVVCGTPLLLLHSVSLSFAGHKRFRVGVQLGERECPAVIIRHFGHRRFGRLDGVWSVVSISLCKPTGQDARPLSLRKNEEEEDFHQIPFQPAVQRRPQSECEIFIRLAFPIFSFNSKVQEFFFFQIGDC